MRTPNAAGLLIALVVFGALSAAPAVARADCPGLKQAQATFDQAIPSTAYLESLRGTAAQDRVKQIDVAIAQARTCLVKGSVDDKSSALAFISALAYRQAYILTHDGVPADRASAVSLAKANEHELNAFESSHMLSSQDSADLDNWLHWDGLMIDQPDQACLDC